MQQPANQYYEDQELNKVQFAQARKQMLLQGFVDIGVWQDSSPQQKMILHQIELAAKSVKEEELED